METRETLWNDSTFICLFLALYYSCLKTPSLRTQTYFQLSLTTAGNTSALASYKTPEFTPGVSNRTKSNKFFIELDRTKSNLIERLNSILFGHRTKSDNNFFCESKSNEIELSVRLSSEIELVAKI